MHLPIRPLAALGARTAGEITSPWCPERDHPSLWGDEWNNADFGAKTGRDRFLRDVMADQSHDEYGKARSLDAAPRESHRSARNVVRPEIGREQGARDWNQRSAALTLAGIVARHITR